MIKEFNISEEKLKLIGQEFLMLGQQHKLEPWELCVVCDLMKQWLQDHCGVEIKETIMIEDGDKT